MNQGNDRGVRTLVLDRNTTLRLSDGEYDVLRAYANLFCRGDLKRAAVELAQRKQRQQKGTPLRGNKPISNNR